MRIVCIVLSSFFCLLGHSSPDESSCFPSTNLSNKKSQINRTNEFRQSEVKKIVKNFESHWSEFIIKNYGKTITVNLDWDKKDINAKATRDMSDNFIINLYGGMARHFDQTEEGIYLVLCHELGHFIGGAPKSLRGRSKLRSWSSAEGQADYFATNKCMIRLFDHGVIQQDYISENWMCMDHYCHIVTKAAMDLGRVFATMKKDWATPVIDARTMRTVNKIFYGHSNPQCRFNTFMAGQACFENYYKATSDLDVSTGSCMGKNNPQGARPSCWFVGPN